MRNLQRVSGQHGDEKKRRVRANNAVALAVADLEAVLTEHAQIAKTTLEDGMANNWTAEETGSELRAKLDTQSSDGSKGSPATPKV